MNHVCTCKSAKRILSLTFPELPERYADVLSYCDTDPFWRAELQDNRIDVTVGDCSGFNGVADVSNFLATFVESPRLEDISGRWSGSAEQAVPLAKFVSHDSSQLLPILRQNRIETFFQPIFAAGGLDLWGYECLMRARDDAGKLISPAQLINWAQQEQLIFMLDRVCRETHLRSAGKVNLPAHAKLLINFMPTAIYQPAFCLQTTMAAAREANIEPSRVIFEVIEQWEVTDRQHLRNILQYYREHGFGTALDDLGSGYSGLSLLADLNPDLIKIDRELVNRSVDSALHRSICAALVRIGHETGKLVLAEGIESADEMNVMISIGADLFQGFYLGKPAAIPATTPVNAGLRLAV